VLWAIAGVQMCDMARTGSDLKVMQLILEKVLNHLTDCITCHKASKSYENSVNFTTWYLSIDSSKKNNEM
jgi:hypothetical protein